jgi:Tol biopolymer transport system component
MGALTASEHRRLRAGLSTVSIAVVAFGLGVSPARAVSSAQTERVSVSSTGGEASGSSYALSISADGQFVAFTSSASNLVDGDTNGASDVFVYDRVTEETRRVSVSSTGAQGNGDSYGPQISADGQFVAFLSSASNLVHVDTNNLKDVFVHDRDTHMTRRVSVSSTGAQANRFSNDPSISADGQFVAFDSWASNLVRVDTNRQLDVFVHDRDTHMTRRVSVSSTGAQADNSSYHPSISADGQLVAFTSSASNLVDGDTNGASDVFVRDRTMQMTRRVSVSSTGAQASDGYSRYQSISADGQFVAFESSASNLVRADTNGWTDVFVYDLAADKTRRVSVSSTGAQADGYSRDPSISADGRFVAFSSSASNLVDADTNGTFDVFVRGPLY